MKSEETYLMFGVGWQQGSYISGSSTFAIDKNDEIYLIEEECGSINWETQQCDWEVYEHLVPIAEAHDNIRMYEKSYRFVERNQKEIISIVRDGGEQDWGRYFIKVFSPRQLNIKE